MNRFTARLKAVSGNRLRLWGVAMVPLTALVVFGSRYIIERPVPAKLVQARQLVLPIKGAGELIALRQSEIGSTSTLRVLSVQTEIGDTVRTGQLLIQLDGEELATHEQAAEAAAQAALEAVDSAERSLQRATAIEQRTERDAQRARDLAHLDPEAIAANELDTLQTSAAIALLDTGVGRTQVRSTQRLHAQARANVQIARKRREEASLRAPFDAVVTARRCSAGETLTPGSTCLTLVDPTSLRVRVRLDESALADVRIGDRAELNLKSQPKPAISARLERIHRAVDVDTREFSADFRLDRIPDRWALGERAIARIHGPTRNAAQTIPLDWVTSAGDRRGAWIARNGRAHWIPLRLGLDDGRDIEVNELPVGATVLQPHGLSEGIRVRPKAAR